MKDYESTEIAYKNGYAQGLKDAVKHGKWKKGVWQTYPDGYVCDRCNTGYEIPYSYCPNCGAKMDLEG